MSVSNKISINHAKLRDFSRDLELNTACREVCVEETFTCITYCDPTDSECISTCLRDELTCGDREY